MELKYVLIFIQSEERGKEEYASTEKTPDARIARSAGNSLDKLGGSSASVDPDGKKMKSNKISFDIFETYFESLKIACYLINT